MCAMNREEMVKGKNSWGSTIIINNVSEFKPAHDSFSDCSSGLPKPLAETISYGLRALDFLSNIPSSLEEDKPRAKKVLWDFVIQESNWLARDFYYERKWKLDIAERLAREAKKIKRERAVSDSMFIYDTMTMAVMSFWLGVVSYDDATLIPDSLKNFVMDVHVLREDEVCDEVEKDAASLFLLKEYTMCPVRITSSLMSHCCQVVEMALYQHKKGVCPLGDVAEGSEEAQETQKGSFGVAHKDFDICPNATFSCRTSLLLRDSVALEFQFGAPMVKLGFQSYVQQLCLDAMRRTLLESNETFGLRLDHPCSMLKQFGHRQALCSAGCLFEGFLDHLNEPISSLDPLVFEMSSDDEEHAGVNKRVGDDLFLKKVRTKIQTYGGALHPLTFQPPHRLRDAPLVYGLQPHEQFFSLPIRHAFLSFVYRYGDLLAVLKAGKRRRQAPKVEKSSLQNQEGILNKESRSEESCRTFSETLLKSSSGKRRVGHSHEKKSRSSAHGGDESTGGSLQPHRESKVKSRHERGDSFGPSEKKSCCTTTASDSPGSSGVSSTWENIIMSFLTRLGEVSCEVKTPPPFPLVMPCQYLRLGTAPVDQFVGVTQPPKFTCGAMTCSPREVDIWEPVEDLMLQRLVQMFRYRSCSPPFLLTPSVSSRDTPGAHELLVASSYWTVNWQLVSYQLNSSFVPFNRGRTPWMCQNRWKTWVEGALKKVVNTQLLGEDHEEYKHRECPPCGIPEEPQIVNALKCSLEKNLPLGCIDMLPPFPPPPRVFVSKEVPKPTTQHQEGRHGSAWECDWCEESGTTSQPWIESFLNVYSRPFAQRTFALKDFCYVNKASPFPCAGGEDNPLEEAASLDIFSHDYGEETDGDLFTFTPEQCVVMEKDRWVNELVVTSCSGTGSSKEVCDSTTSPLDGVSRMCDGWRSAASRAQQDSATFFSLASPPLVETVDHLVTAPGGKLSSVLLENFGCAQGAVEENAASFCGGDDTGGNLRRRRKGPATVRELMEVVFHHDAVGLLEKLLDTGVCSGQYHHTSASCKQELLLSWKRELLAQHLTLVAANHLELLELRRLALVLIRYGDSIQHRSFIKSRVPQLFLGDHSLERHIRSVCMALNTAKVYHGQPMNHGLPASVQHSPICELLNCYNINITRDLLPVHVSHLSGSKRRTAPKKSDLHWGFWTRVIHPSILRLFSRFSNTENSAGKNEERETVKVSTTPGECNGAISLVDSTPREEMDPQNELMAFFGPALAHFGCFSQEFLDDAPLVFSLLGLAEHLLEELGFLLRFNKHMIQAAPFHPLTCVSMDSVKEFGVMVRQWSQLSHASQLSGLLKRYLMPQKQVLTEVEVREPHLWMCRSCGAASCLCHEGTEGCQDVLMGRPGVSGQGGSGAVHGPVSAFRGGGDRSTLRPFHRGVECASYAGPGVHVMPWVSVISCRANFPGGNPARHGPEASYGGMKNGPSSSQGHEAMGSFSASQRRRATGFSGSPPCSFSGSPPNGRPQTPHANYTGPPPPLANAPDSLKKPEATSLQRFVVRPSAPRKGAGSLASAVFRQPGSKHCSLSPDFSPQSVMAFDHNAPLSKWKEDQLSGWKHKTGFPNTYTGASRRVHSRPSLCSTGVSRAPDVPFASRTPLALQAHGFRGHPCLLPSHATQGVHGCCGSSPKLEYLGTWAHPSNASEGRNASLRCSTLHSMSGDATSRQDPPSPKGRGALKPCLKTQGSSPRSLDATRESVSGGPTSGLSPHEMFPYTLRDGPHEAMLYPTFQCHAPVTTDPTKTPPCHAPHHDTLVSKRSNLTLPCMDEVLGTPCPTPLGHHVTTKESTGGNPRMSHPATSPNHLSTSHSSTTLEYRDMPTGLPQRPLVSSPPFSHPTSWTPQDFNPDTDGKPGKIHSMMFIPGHGTLVNGMSRLSAEPRGYPCNLNVGERRVHPVALPSFNGTEKHEGNGGARPGGASYRTVSHGPPTPHSPTLRPHTLYAKDPAFRNFQTSPVCSPMVVPSGKPLHSPRPQTPMRLHHSERRSLQTHSDPNKSGTTPHVMHPHQTPPFMPPQYHGSWPPPQNLEYPPDKRFNASQYTTTMHNPSAAHVTPPMKGATPLESHALQQLPMLYSSLPPTALSFQTLLPGSQPSLLHTTMPSHLADPPPLTPHPFHYTNFHWHVPPSSQYPPPSYPGAPHELAKLHTPPQPQELFQNVHSMTRTSWNPRNYTTPSLPTPHDPHKNVSPR